MSRFIIFAGLGEFDEMVNHSEFFTFATDGK